MVSCLSCEPYASPHKSWKVSHWLGKVSTRLLQRDQRLVNDELNCSNEILVTFFLQLFPEICTVSNTSDDIRIHQTFLYDFCIHKVGYDLGSWRSSNEDIDRRPSQLYTKDENMILVEDLEWQAISCRYTMLLDSLQLQFCMKKLWGPITKVLNTSKLFDKWMTPSLPLSERFKKSRFKLSITYIPAHL